jgi:hypothetical protein
MAIVKKITQPSNNLSGSLNGRLLIDEGRGRIVVTDLEGQEKTVQDVDGFHLTDGTVETHITPSNIIQNDGTNDRILLGDDA